MGNQFKNVAIIACLKTFLFVFNIVFWNAKKQYILRTVGHSNFKSSLNIPQGVSLEFDFELPTNKPEPEISTVSAYIKDKLLYPQLTGLLLLVVGLWAEFDLYKYMELSTEFSGTAPHVLIGIAGLIIVISSVAFSCIIKGQPVLLYVYGGFLACIFVMDAGVGASVACYRDTFAESLHDGLTQSVLAHDPHRANFDFAQSTMNCCGVSNYTDWVRLSPQRVIPVSCCIDPNRCVTANYNDVYQRGCYEVILEYLQANMNVIFGFAIGTALFPLVGTILSCCLARYIKKSKYDVMN